jgi:predicted CopG family antitoxin
LRRLEEDRERIMMRICWRMKDERVEKKKKKKKKKSGEQIN